MRLERISSNFMHSHKAEANKYSADSIFSTLENDECVYVDFFRFGAGSENFSDFVVSMEWADVEAAIRAFAGMGNAEAIRLQRAKRLAIAVDEFVKNSN